MIGKLSETIYYSVFLLEFMPIDGTKEKEKVNNERERECVSEKKTKQRRNFCNISV